MHAFPHGGSPISCPPSSPAATASVTEARRPGPHGGSHPVQVGYVQKTAVSPGSLWPAPPPLPRPRPTTPEAWNPLGTHVV